MLSEGLGAATSVRVSNELGAGQQKSARFAAQTATVLATIEGTLIAVLMISIRKVWGHLYSNEANVRVRVAKEGCVCQSGSSLPVWSAVWYCVSVCLPLWRKGTWVGNHSRSFCTNTNLFSDRSADKLGQTGSESSRKDIFIIEPAFAKSCPLQDI
ncbi:hypothetical protein P3S67_029714 [Capsicum chacoense]